MTQSNSVSRRNFLRNTSAITAGLAAFSIVKPEHVSGAEANSMIQLGIVGTGGRGQYDGRNLFKTGKVEIMALADYFDFQMEDAARDFQVESKNCFAGIDGYKQMMALSEVDAVLLTTAPYFRPIHFDAAVEAGKHVFAEKPIAVDAYGCRQFLASGEKAKQKKLTVGVGLQSRNDATNQQMAKLIQEGAIGRPLVGHSTRMGGDLWRRERPAHFTERDHQVRHWLYYLWAGGDFIVEMHIHNLDIFNWFTGMLPVSAYGKGGRDVRKDVGDIFDHLQVTYEYPDGFTLSHTGTQIPNGYEGSERQILGTAGYCDGRKGLVSQSGQTVTKEADIKEATEIEMEQFVASILGEIPTINNSDYVTTSTFTCILGRTAAYENRKITWDELWNSNQKIEMPA